MPNFYKERGEQNPIKTLEVVQKNIDTAVNDIRTIAHNLMPINFEEQLFDETVKNYLTSINSDTPIHIEYEVSQAINRVDSTIQINIYRIFTEALNNALKHADCQNITVQFLLFDNTIQLMMEDDGKGFDTANPLEGIGLKNMKSRVDYLHGMINIDSNKKGTTIIVEIPI